MKYGISLPITYFRAAIDAITLVDHAIRSQILSTYSSKAIWPIYDDGGTSGNY